MNEKSVVVIPTYNEATGLRGLVGRIRRAVPELQILVVDDSSPDGTGVVADQLSAADALVHVLHRPRKEGLGPAYQAGFRWALDHDFELIAQSDADGSHRPEDLPRLLGAAQCADLVVGSRWVAGGSAPGWAWGRRLLSHAGSWYAGAMLRLAPQDITGGFRVFHAEVLRNILAEGVASRGYCFQIEMLAHAVSVGARVVEVPITFEVRSSGESKMSARIIGEALIQVTAWGIADRWGIPRSASRHEFAEQVHA